MKASTREWIKKAESDWLLAVSLMRRRKPPVRDQAGFLFQQSAEKYEKARMEAAGVRVSTSSFIWSSASNPSGQPRKSIAELSPA